MRMNLVKADSERRENRYDVLIVKIFVCGHIYVVFDRALQGSQIKSHLKNFPKDKKRKTLERKLSRILLYLRNF